MLRVPGLLLNASEKTNFRLKDAVDCYVLAASEYLLFNDIVQLGIFYIPRSGETTNGTFTLHGTGTGSRTRNRNGNNRLLYIMPNCSPAPRPGTGPDPLLCQFHSVYLTHSRSRTVWTCHKTVTTLAFSCWVALRVSDVVGYGSVGTGFTRSSQSQVVRIFLRFTGIVWIVIHVP